MSAINEIVTKEALEQLQELIDKIGEADRAFFEMSAEGKKAFQAMATPPKTSDELNKQLKVTNQLLKDLNANFKQTDTAATKLANSKKTLNQEYRNEIINNREIRKGYDEEAVKLSNLTTYIQKLTVDRAKASRTVADYNAKIAMGTALTEEQSAELAQATASFQKYDNAIKAGKKSIGDAREYVGQYERANWGLQNSVNQLTRELPALGMNASTFFLAISNNIGPFKDAIDDINVRNAQLRAEGKETTSVWKQLGSSLLSLNTLLSVGVTLLVVYGKEIGNWTKELFGAKTALDDLNKAQEDVNASAITGLKNSFNDVQATKSLLAVVKNTTLETKYRKEALSRLMETYPDYFKNIGKETELNEKVAASIERLYADFQKKETADELDKAIIKNKEKILELNQKITEIEKENPNLPSRQNIVKMADLMVTGDEQKYKDYVVEINGLYGINAEAQKEVNRLRGESAGLLIRQTKDTDDNTRAIKLNTKAREDYLASEYELWRLRKQNESDSNKAIMDDEKMGFELRALASEQFYQNEIELAQRAQIEEIRVLDLATEDKLRINQNEYLNYEDSLNKQLKKSELTAEQKKAIERELSESFKQYQSDKVGIEKDAENKRLIINENYIQKYLNINKEMVGKLKEMYNELELAKKDFQISEDDLKGAQEINNLLQNITPDMSIEEIEASLNQISKINERTNLDINKKEKELHLERLKRLKEQVEGEIVLQLIRQGKTDEEIQMALRNNKFLINLGKQILDAEKDVQEAKNAIHNQDIKNILEEKKVWKEINDSILESRIELFKKLGDLANQGFENVISYYDREIEKSNDYYDALLENAEAGSEQEQMLQEEKEAKAEQLRKRKIDAERKQAIVNKVLGVAQVIIETSKAIAAINATAAKYDGIVPGSGQAYRASQIPLVVGSAAAQTAIILATPLPQYKDGRGKGKDEFAIVGDGGRSEVIERGSGKLEVTPNVPTITHLGKDDIVHKSLEDFERSKLAIQNASIMASFGSQSRQLEMFDYYLGKELRGISSKIEKGIEKGFKKAKIQNYIKMPPIDIGHYDYKNRGLT